MADKPPSQPNWARRKERHIFAVSASGLMVASKAQQKYNAPSQRIKLSTE